MRYKFLFIAVYLLYAFYISSTISEETCPNPSVKKRTIILSTESTNNGAIMIGKDIVKSARDCYNLCCRNPTCNVAVMHYKEEKNILGETLTKKICYLFACGSPSVCTYDYHNRYAIIDLGSRKDEVQERNDEKINPTMAPTTQTTTTTATTTTTTAERVTTQQPTKPQTVDAKTVHSIDKIPTTNLPGTTKEFVHNECNEACPYNYDPVCGSDGTTYDNRCLFNLARCKTPSLKLEYDEACRECPPGVPMAMCSDDPCKISTCPTNKQALCKANFCGGCNAVYFAEDGSKINCSDSDVAVSGNHNEQSILVSEADYEEATDESLPLGKSSAQDPYYTGERRKWLPDPKSHNESVLPSQPTGPVVVVVKDARSLMSLPLLIALIICIVLLIGVIYRVKCMSRGKAKKLPVDDGDYLINGMYL